jgi:hypothetical protein
MLRVLSEPCGEKPGVQVSGEKSMKWRPYLVFLVLLAIPGYLLTVNLTRVARERAEEARVRAKMEGVREEGRTEAEQDIAAGRLKLRSYGLPGPWFFREIQLRKERLGVEPDGVGDCMVPDDVVERANGYNERMKEEMDRRFGAGALDRIHGEVVRDWQKTQEEREGARRKE